MQWTRAAYALAGALLVACVDSERPVGPTLTSGNVGLRSSISSTGPLAYVAEVPTATGWYHPVHIADMNGDARPDILIGGWDVHQIQIWQYDQALQKAVLAQTIGGLPYDVNGIATGDMDKDGDVDVLTAIRGYGTFLCRNNGGGSWSIVNIDGRYAWNVQVADVDRDGNLDAVSSLDYGGVALLYGNGAGGFVLGSSPAFIGSMSVGVSDFNNDGLPDLIGPDFGTERLMAYQNLGGRTWSANLGPPTAHPFQLVSENAPSAFDLYGNGNLDQVASYHAVSGYFPPMTVVIFEGAGAPLSPSWTMRTLDVLPYRGLPVGVADLDDDGDLDIFVGGSSGALGFRAYRGDGTGNFTAENVPYAYGLGSRHGFSVVDFNGDGTSDIVATRHPPGVYESNAGFAILYQTPPPNVVPTVDAGADASVTEGSPFSQGGSFVDPDANSWTATVDFGDGSGVQALPLSGKTFALNHTYADNGAFTVTVTVNDGKDIGTDVLLVNVTNVAPTLTSVTGATTPIAINTSTSISLAFTDPAGAGDAPYAVRVDWGEGAGFVAAGTTAYPGGSFSHTFAEAGVYTICATVTDKDGGVSNTACFEFAVVYDPSAGFVTGGGWILSPAGAYRPDPLLTGKATFGFVSRYKKGATIPTGNTEFQFHTAGMNFSSTSYEWLVIAGPQAKFRGEGTVNGIPGYGFMLSAWDGQVAGGSGVDKFSIKIWSLADPSNILYNNHNGTDDQPPTTAIGGGSIVIHK